jgi:hypothetical protein
LPRCLSCLLVDSVSLTPCLMGKIRKICLVLSKAPRLPTPKTPTPKGSPQAMTAPRCPPPPLPPNYPKLSIFRFLLYLTFTEARRYEKVPRVPIVAAMNIEICLSEGSIRAGKAESQGKTPQPQSRTREVDSNQGKKPADLRSRR